MKTRLFTQGFFLEGCIMYQSNASVPLPRGTMQHLPQCTMPQGHLHKKLCLGGEHLKIIFYFKKP